MMSKTIKAMKIQHLIPSLIVLACASLSISAAEPEVRVYHNFTGYSFLDRTATEPNVEARLNQFTAMAVRDGKIIATGDHGLLTLLPEAKAIDLRGRVVLPGLVDAHGHIVGIGEYLQQVDLRGISSRTASVAEVANYADQNLHLDWIVGRGWNQVLWPERQFPSKEDIDSVISDRPVYLTRVDAHAAWVNSKALEIAGITADTPSPEGGQIVRDSDGQPTGVLIDTAMGLVSQHIPTPSQAQIAETIQQSVQHLLALGITQVHDAGVSHDELEAYKHLLGNDNLDLRVHAMVSGTEPLLPNILAEGAYLDAQHRLQINSVKLYGDGALGSRGAALIEPYSDDPENSGLLVTPEERLLELFRLVDGAGFQINYHAIGDYTNRLALDTFATIFEENAEDTEQPTPLNPLRHRVEHAQIVAVDDIPRFKTLGIIPSMQPTHATSDMNMAEDRVGSERIAGAYAWRTFLDQGSAIAAGSDFPVELANPFYGIHAAVTRQDRQNQPVEGWYPEQRMSVAEAIRSFTLDAAWAGHLNETTGTLEPGKYADFIIVDRDPFSIAPDQLWRIRVHATFVAGELKYRFRP